MAKIPVSILHHRHSYIDKAKYKEALCVIFEMDVTSPFDVETGLGLFFLANVIKKFS